MFDINRDVILITGILVKIFLGNVILNQFTLFILTHVIHEAKSWQISATFSNSIDLSKK